MESIVGGVACVGKPNGRLRSPWVWVAIAGAILLAAYAPVIRYLVRDWIVDDNVSHGFFVPLVAGYVAWQKRSELRSIELAPNWWGLVVVVLAALQMYAATLGVELFLGRVAFVIAIAGVVLFIGGAKLVRILAFPLFLLLFMIPIPAILYNQLTLPLQLFASKVAEQALTLLGIPVIREGNILELARQRLSVVEACSGIRSLLSLSFLSLVYAYLFDRKVWMRGVLFVATVPIAVLANASRVTLSGILSEYDPEAATGALHLAEGWVVFMVSLGILVATHATVNLGYRAWRSVRNSGTGSGG